jgi:hypothetical protein
VCGLVINNKYTSNFFGPNAGKVQQMHSSNFFGYQAGSNAIMIQISLVIMLVIMQQMLMRQISLEPSWF